MSNLTFQHKPSKETESASTVMPVRIISRQNPDVGSIHQLQRTIGNQAVLQLLKTNARRENVRSGHTLEFYVIDFNSRSNASPTEEQNRCIERFRRLVQRLLPLGSRFNLGPDQWVKPPSLGYLSGYYSATLDHTGPSLSSDPQWKHNLRDEIALSISSPHQRFRLEDETRTFVGGFHPYPRPDQPVAPRLAVQIPTPYGRLDIHDLESINDQLAATFLAHELVEQRGSQIRNLSYEEAHEQAMLVEANFMGGERRTDSEFETNGIDFRNIPPEQFWQWWIPYERSNGSIIAAILYMRGYNIERSRRAGFPSLTRFEESASASGLDRIRR